MHFVPSQRGIAKDANNLGTLCLVSTYPPEEEEVCHAKTARQSSLCVASVPAVACLYRRGHAYLGAGNRRHHRNLYPDSCCHAPLPAGCRSCGSVPHW